MCRTRGSISVPLDSQATSLPTELWHPALRNCIDSSMSVFHYGFMQVPSVPNQHKTAENPAKTHRKCIKNAHRGNHKLKNFSGEVPRTPLARRGGGRYPLSCSPQLVTSALALTTAGPLLNTWRRACFMESFYGLLYRKFY